ncbi:MAG: polysaccharide deacetylase family protein [Negativicutes bacterium]|nr:polysaccharide deacetylase family protein [Negativicutes bacterium]
MRYKSLVLALIVSLLLVSLLASSGVGTRAVAGRQYRPANLTDVPVLVYHKVDTLYHALSMTPQEFDEQMSYLYENGYHTITPDQLMAYIKYGKDLPEKPVLITFDDGYLDNYTNAYFIMKKYGFTGTIFLVTSLVGQDSRFMNWEQAREMQQGGFVFGSHTVDHQPLTKLTPEEALAELVDSSEIIEQELGVKPCYFAYPTGAYNQQLEQLVRQAGYKAAFTIRFGQAGLESDPLAIERIPVFKSSQSFRSFYYRLTAAPLLERLGIIRN